MKKITVLLISCMLVGSILFTGCSGKQQNESNVHSRNNVSSQDNKIEQETMDSEDTIFLVDKVVFEDGIISLKCKEITANNIIFEATNKSKYDVEWLQLDISLDGTQLSLYADSSSDQNIKAGETREIVQVGDIDIPEHNKMSLSGDIFIDGSSKGTIDVCDVDLGGNENTYSTLEKEKLVYDDENVAVYFNSIDINQMNFCIENKMDNAITVGFWGDEDLEIDGSVYGSSVATINSHSSGIYIGYLYSSSNDNIQIMDFQSFDGIMKIKNQKNQDIESINLNFTSD